MKIKFFIMKKFFFRQKSHWDCGLSCLAMAHYYFFHDQTIGKRLFYETNAYQGLNLLQLEKIAQRFQLKLNSYQTDWKTMNKLLIQLPLILPTQIKRNNHYLIILKKQKNWYLIGDPEKEDFQWWKKETLQKHFKNVIIFVFPISKKTKNYEWPVLITRNWLLWKIWSGGCVCTLVLTILNLLVQFGVKTLIEQTFFLFKKPDLSLLLGISIIFLSQTIITILWKIQLAVWQFLYHKQQNKIFFHVVAKLDWMQFAKQGYPLLWRRYHDLQIINNYQVSIGLTWIRGVYLIIGSLIALIIFDFWITLPILIVIIFNALLNLMIWPKQQESMRKMHLKEQTINHQIHQKLKQWEDWKGRQLWEEKSKKLLNGVIKNAKFAFQNFWYHFFNQITDQQISFWSQIILIYFLYGFGFKIHLTAAQLLFILGLSASIFSESQILFGFWVERKKIDWLKTELKDFLEWNQLKQKESKSDFVLNGQRLRFTNLNFSYNNYDWLWKNDINGVFGQHLWISGKNGSGKSTFLKLFLNPQLTYKGEIWFDNQEWRTLPRQKIEKIIYLNSHAELLEGTVEKNILIYQKNALSIDLLNWMKIMLNKHHLEWNTNCRERHLSAGEKQIVVFLSLFAADHKIYLLDEVLNSVETTIKKELMIRFLQQKASKIVFYVSHNKMTKLPLERLILS